MVLNAERNLLAQREEPFDVVGEHRYNQSKHLLFLHMLLRVRVLHASRLRSDSGLVSFLALKIHQTCFVRPTELRWAILFLGN
jgi:hypothetical protein